MMTVSNTSTCNGTIKLGRQHVFIVQKKKRPWQRESHTKIDYFFLGCLKRRDKNRVVSKTQYERKGEMQSLEWIGFS
jgi:hypothetical protein